MEKEKLRAQATILITLMLAGMILFSSLALTKGQTEATIYVEPAAVTGLEPPTTFTIRVKIANVANLYGLDLQFTWEPTVIQYVSHVKHIPVETYPDGILHSPSISVRNQVDETASMPGADPGTRYWLAESSMLPAPVFNGNGTIFEMTFKVMSTGYSPLRVVSCTLADVNGSPIPFTVINGYFDNRPAPPPPKGQNLTVSPSSIVNSSLTPSHIFPVDINVEADQLYGFEFSLAYNPAVLEITDVIVNPMFPMPVVTQTSGDLTVSGALVSPEPSFNGTAVLATITFHVLSLGESPLDLHDVAFADINSAPLPLGEVRDGYFNNQLITRMFVDPPEIIDPSMKPGDLFSVNIDIADAVGMYDYEFVLSYDPSIITCLGAIVIPPTSDTSFSVEQIINSTLGSIFVKVQYYSPAPPIDILGAKAVTQITFMVKAYGQTVLDLHDANISTPSGGFLDPILSDGFFATLLRDVSIELVTVTSANKVYPGRIVTIEVVPMNRGNMTVETFDVTLHYSNNTIGTQSVTLDPWSNTTLTFYWNTSGLASCNNFTIWAEASTVPYELNLDNNFYYDGWVKIKLFGDVNGDGVIDILDIVAISIAYGSNPASPNWNPEADLVPQYGFINILDIVTCSSKYGQRCP